jgi:transposase
MLLAEGPTLYRVHLTDEQRIELHQRTRAAGLKPRTRDRLEMVRLSDGGLPVPEISRLLRVSPQRVRFWLRRFLEGGFDALPDQPHAGRPGQLTPAVLAALRAELDRGDRTWTLPQIAEWLEATHGISLCPAHLGVLLRRAGLSCRRTEPDLNHRQDPAQVAERTADLETLEKGERPDAWTSATSTRRALR